jgi:hypothetical protein
VRNAACGARRSAQFGGIVDEIAVALFRLAARGSQVGGGIVLHDFAALAELKQFAQRARRVIRLHERTACNDVVAQCEAFLVGYRPRVAPGPARQYVAAHDAPVMLAAGRLIALAIDVDVFR